MKDEGGARDDLLCCGIEESCSVEKIRIIMPVSEESTERDLLRMNDDESEKVLEICLQVLIWFWITALGRGLGLPELEDIPVDHGNRTPSVIKLTVRITRRRIVNFLSSAICRNTEQWL